MRSRLASTARGLTLSALALTSLLGSARASTPSANLASLSEEFWQGSLEASPTFATSIGDPRYDDRLADISPAGVAREIARLQGVLVRAREIPDATLSSPDRLTRTALITELENQLAQISCKFEEWVVDPMGGPQVMLMSLPDYTRIETPKDAAKFVKRIRTSGRYFDDHIANLISGLEKGRVASRDAVQKTIQQLERLAKTPDESLAVWKPALAEHPGWASADRQRFSKDLRTAIATTLRPALARYHALLSTRVLAASRPPEKAGLASLPGGIDCYRSMIRAHTSLDLDPRELHQIGLSQVAKFRHDLDAAAGDEESPTSTRPQLPRAALAELSAARRQHAQEFRLARDVPPHRRFLRASLRIDRHQLANSRSN